MKTQTARILFPFLAIGILTISGCALPQMVKKSKEQNLTVEPNPLEVHADTVRFTMAVNLPVKMLKPKKAYTVNTYYRYGTQEIQLESVEFRSDDFANSDTQEPRVSQEYSFRYQDGMERGNIEIKGVASNPKNGNFLESDRIGVADGIITTSRLVQPSYAAAYADHGYNDQEELIPTNVEFYFDQGRSVFKKSEIESDKGAQFAAFIAEKNVTRTVTITGTHSPEGKDAINEELAGERAAAIEKWYREQMDKYDYQDQANEIRFIQKPIIKDWNQLKTALASYDGISSSEKSEFNSIINGTGSFEQKEKQLQKLSNYKKVFDDVYPQLRTAKTEVLTVKPKKSPEEIASLALSNPSALTVPELAYAAAKNPSLEEKKSIYEAAAKKDDTWMVHNNLGAVHLEMAIQANARNRRNLLSTALNHFQISNQKNANVEAQANMGMVMAMQENLWGAPAALTKALSMNPGNDVRQGISGAKGYVEIRVGRYDLAISSLNRATNGATDQFNKSLVQLLRKDYRNAQATIEAALNSDSDAIAYYLAAVAAARQNNENKVVEHLRKAVGADADLKAKAVNDLEFRQFSGNQAFIDLMN